MSAGTMARPPRKSGNTFLSGKQLLISIVQGLLITSSCLGLGYYFMQQEYNEATVRTIIFLTLLFSNIFLTLVNRSFYYSIFTTLKYKNYLVWLIIGITLLFIAVLLFVPSVQHIFLLVSLSPRLIVICMLSGLVGTFWLELYKLFKRRVSQ